MEVAHGSVVLDLNDAEVVAGLRAIDSEFDRAMAKIDRQKAVAKISADIAPLEDELANAKRKLRDFKAQRAEAKLDADKDALDKKIKTAEAEIRHIDGKKAVMEIDLKGEERVLAAEYAIAEAERARQKAGEQAAKRLDDAAKKEARQKEKDYRESRQRVVEESRAYTENERIKQKAYDDTRRSVIEEARAYGEAERLREQAYSQERRMSVEEARAHAEDSRRKQKAYDDERRLAVEEARAHSVAAKIQADADKKAAAAQDFRDRGAAKDLNHIIALQREYAKLTDRLERIDKMRPIGKEARAKVELDASGVAAKMLLIKRELNILGAEPPVDIKADIDQRGLKRARQSVTNTASWIGNKLSKLSDTTIRLGPFTTSLKGLGVALSFLGPSIVAVTGALGSLIGVAGAGLMGASALGAAGATGLATSFLGLKFATRNTRQEIANARTAINAYQKQVEKTGASSDKAKTKFDEMQHTFASISPLAREAAKGTERFYKIWDRNTRPTQQSLGNIARDGFNALNRITPMWGKATNDLSSQLDRSLRSGFRFLRSGEFAQDFRTITGAFNREVPTIMRTLGNLGRAFLNFAREGANNLHILTGGFENMSERMLRFTQRDDFGATVKRWVTDAQDVARFLGALTRVIVHFFGAGSDAGDSFLRTMTNALNRWDRFIQSSSGHNRIADFFTQSVKGAQALYHLLAPIIQLFSMWATGLEPAVRVITTIVAWITQAVAGLGKLVGLTDPIKTLGATMGAIFAISKIGAFVSYLARAAGLIKTMAAAEGIGGLFKNIGSGEFLRQLRSGGGIGAAATQGAAAMEAGILAGSERGAAVMAAAIAEAGAVAGAEGGIVNAAEGAGAARLLGPTGAPLAASAAGAGAVAAEAGAAEAATVGLGGALGALGLTAGVAATGGLALLGGAIAYLIFKGDDAYSSTKRYRDQADRLTKELPSLNAEINAAEAAYGDQAYATQSANDAYKDSRKHLKDVRSELAKTKEALDKAKASNKGVTQAQQDYNNALRDSRDAIKQERDSFRQRFRERQSRNRLLAAAEDKAGQAAATSWLAAYDNKVGNADKRRDVVKDLAHWTDEMNKRDPGAGQRDDMVMGAAYREAKQHVDELTQSLGDLDSKQRSMDQSARDAVAVQAAVPINLQREWNHLLPLVGQAQVQLGRLARSAPNAAKVIGNKFQNPINAGKIAAQANRSVQAGVSSNIVYRILVNSKGAEDAIRRLRLTRLESKTLKIIEEGGAKALRLLQQLVGVKLAPKVQAILASDRDAKSKIKAIIALGVPPKIARILGDPKGALRAVAVANGLTVKQLTQIINRAMGARPELTPPPPVPQIVKRKVMNAIGTGPTGVRHDAIIGEGGGPEWYVNTKTGIARKTSGPEEVTLGPADAVIPTEHKYRQRGVEIFHSIAERLDTPLLQRISNDLGLSAYRSSKSISESLVSDSTTTSVSKSIFDSSTSSTSTTQVNSLIGEGGGPEWRVNTKTGVAYKTTGPQFVALDDHDAIIPTEPAYRQRGIEVLNTISHDINPDLLTKISHDLGLAMFKTSKKVAPKKAAAKPKAAAPTHADIVKKANTNPAAPAGTSKGAASLSSTAKKRHKLPYASDYRAGGVPEDWVTNKYTKAHTALTDAKSERKNAEDDLKRSMNLSKKKPQGGGDSEYDRDQHHRGQLRKKIKNLNEKITKKDGLQVQNNLWARRLGEVRSINAQIDHWNSIIATDKTLMDNAATRYNRTGADADLTAWTNARDDRMKAIGKLRPILNTALKAARALKVPGIQVLLDSLGGDISGLDATVEETATAESPIETTTFDLDWLLKNTTTTGVAGVADGTNADTAFSKATADLAVARTNNKDDLPGTSEREDIISLQDDIAPATQLVTILTKALTDAQATGDSDLIAEAANALTGAKGDLQTINDTISEAANQTGPSQADLMDTSRATLYRDYGSNFSPNVNVTGPSGEGYSGQQANPATLASAPAMRSTPLATLASRDNSFAALTTPSLASSVAGGASAASAMSPNYTGSSSGAGAAPSPAPIKTVNVTNNFSAPPEDPHTWSAGVNFELGAMV